MKHFSLRAWYAFFVVCALGFALPASAKIDTVPVIHDRILSKNEPSKNSICSMYGNIGSWDAYGGHAYRYIAQVDLAKSTMTAAEITEAFLKIDRVSTSWDDNDSYVLHRVTQSWDPAAVTWGNQPSYDPVAIAGVSAGYGIFKFNITALVKEWKINPSSSYGILIKKTNEDTTLKRNKGSFACSTYSPQGGESVPVVDISNEATGSTPSAAPAPVASPAGSAPSVPVAAGNQNQLPADAYKAIVKIKTFALNTRLALAQMQSGSGVLIDPEGIVLTNYHVVSVRDELFDQERDTAYQLCLTVSSSQAPDCSYFGRLIARDKKLDIALLKMYPVPGASSLSRFPYVRVNATDATQIGDALYALGYPGIGGDNITITSGTVSGKQEKYGMQWIKTDAVISYGSSGGAAIDKGGNVIGITTEAYSDLLGTLGYVTNAASLNPWIAQHKGDYPQDNALESRLMKHARKQLSLKGSLSFMGDFIPFAMNIAEGWEYEFEDEDILRATKPGDQEGGGLMLTFYKTPYFYSRAKIVPEFKRSLFEAGLLSLVTISSVKDVTVNGIQGQRIEISVFGEKTYFYFFVHKNYVFKLVLDYGEKDKDKAAIEKMVKSFKMTGVLPAYKEQRSFASQNPVFRVKEAKGWAMIPQNVTDDPLAIGYSAIPEVFASVNITKVTDEMKGYTNTQYLDHQKQLVQDINKLGAIADLKASIPSSNAKYRLSKALPSVIMAEEELRTVSTNKVFFRGLGYTVKSGDYYLEFHLSVYSDSIAVYRKAKQAFNTLAQGFSLSK